MDGDKLRGYLDSLNLSQAEKLAMTEFSQGKLYTLFKQATIVKRDRDQLIKDFKLPENFFESTPPPKEYVIPDDYEELKIRLAILEERTEQYEARLKDKEKLIAILEKQVSKK